MTHDLNLVAHDLDTGLIIANRVAVAKRRVDRAVGLLGRNHLESGEGLWIMPCHGVHTWGMRFSIDVLALDAAGVVVDAISTLRPWRFRLPRPGGCSVLELPAGTLEDSQTTVGHRIKIYGWNSAFTPSLNGVRTAAPDTAATPQAQTGT
jgi:uncharacterized membrane protein (UPF0127 family)